ncbi:MAG TPA: N-acetylglucosamine-6-phosphate deacetylase [Terracidiphilus sp.]|jgi:N-acetylglucosamine-6-phosphate deacetylase|nr:N-acetylglucosamine-6-phosphate deacetylase [Terracidiphilus sp.]
MGFFDLQVNGYGGVDLNADDITADDMARMCEQLEADGTDGILATVITDHIPVMISRLKRIVACCAANSAVRRVIRGIHIEGPFISPLDGYRGAHPEDAVVASNIDLAKTLLDAADGMTRIVTLAPEQDPGQRVTRMLADIGVMVACGHSNASIDQLNASVDAGLKMFTHLGNGCPARMARHDNIIQRALSRSGDLWFCFIADGRHIPLFALANYLKLAGYDRSIVVTDAIAAASAGPGEFTLGRWRVTTDEDNAVRSADKSHFVGSTATMRQCFDHLAGELHLPPEVCRRLLDENPRQALCLP